MKAREDLPSIVCLLLSLFGFSLATGRWIVGIPLMVFAAFTPSLRDRLALRHRGLPLLLAVPVLFMANLWPYQSRYQLDINLGVHGSLYLTLLAMLLLVRKKQSSFAWVCLGTGSLLAMSGAELSATEDMALVAPYGLSVLFGLRAQIPLRRGTIYSRLGLWTGVMISSVLVVALTVSFVFGFVTYYGSLVIWIQSVLAQQVGFSKSGRVGSVTDLKRADRNKLILRVYSDAPPEHLRGVVYQSYWNGKWRVVGEKEEMRPFLSGTGEGLDREERLYVLKGRPKRRQGDQADLGIEHVSDLGTNCFLPLDACVLSTVSPYLELYPGGVVESREFEDTVRYRIFRDPAPVAMEGRDPVYLSLPEGEPVVQALDRFIEENLNQGTGQMLPDEIIPTVAFVLSSKFQYNLDVEFDPQQDPVLQFLEKERQGHCELFASLGCLLLRRLGVPARYVAGFVCREKNPYGGFWIARAWDAHAWVEYWDGEDGWRVAEFTPAPGLSLPRKSQGISAIWDAVQAKLFQWIRFLQEMDLSGMRRRFRSAVSRVPGRTRALSWGVALLFLLGSSLYLAARLRSKKRSSVTRSKRRFPVSLAAEREAFLRLERRLVRKGYGRKDHETLLEYGQRLSKSQLQDKERLVSFIERYADFRYRPIDV